MRAVCPFQIDSVRRGKETEKEGGGVSVSLATRLHLISRAQNHKEVLAVS